MEEVNGTWELVEGQLTLRIDGGIRRKGKVEGDPSAFTWHDTAGWTVRYKRQSRTGDDLTYPDGPLEDDPIDSVHTFGQ